MGEDVALGGESDCPRVVGAAVARGIAQPEEIGIGGDGCIDATAGNRLEQESRSSSTFGVDVGRVGDGEITGGTIGGANAADRNQLLPGSDRAGDSTAAAVADGSKADGAFTGGRECSCVAEGDVTTRGVAPCVGAAEQVPSHFGEESAAAAGADGEDGAGRIALGGDEAAGAGDLEITSSGINRYAWRIGAEGCGISGDAKDGAAATAEAHDVETGGAITFC